MSKRGRRASSSASRGEMDDVEDDSDLEMPQTLQRKRRKPDPGELCQQIYDTIRCFKKEDGSLLCDSFIRAPKRRQEPHYYEVVSQPIDLLRVQQKLKTDTYDDIEELSSDIELLVNNAKAFYKTDSAEYRDAVTLWNLFTQTRHTLENSTSEELKQSSRMSRLASTCRKSTTSLDNAEGELSETSTTNDDDETFEDFFVAVMSATVEGRPLHPAFLNLPSKKQYPEYYDVIKSPIDLRMVAAKVQNCDYASAADMERDLLAMTKNACLFNEPGSQIYKDAKTLKKHIQAKRVELEHGRIQTPAKTSERIRSKRSVRPVALSLSSAAVSGTIEIPDSDTEKNLEDHSDTENSQKDSPQWRLLETIRNFPGNNGPMSEAFWRLPSKRYYPDYYKAIKNPISLSQIRDKIRRMAYGTLSEVAGDMNIMFENAKQYNVPTSKLYKAAVKLQRLMQQNVQEMLDIIQDSSSDDDESLSSMKSSVVRGRGRPPKNSAPSTPPATSSTPAPLPAPPLKKKLHSLQRHLIEFTCSDGRQPMLLFMEKPSKKLYPDYYTVIDRPIDMLTIESNIKNERYTSLEQIVNDFRLMFSNCRQYNEEGSMIYEDANLLEKALTEKLRELNSSSLERKAPIKVVKNKAKLLSPFEQKLRTLYDAIRDYREPKGNRQLALIFMKLPNKSEYPDYYELIKNPIDMEKIAHKLKVNTYASVTELASDFVLMFDNACKYNEPDSLIYKDALVLQRICLQTKQMLREDDESVPDVSAAVQEILLTLFTTVYNHQDEEGRCFSDSLAELPEHDEVNGVRTRGVSLDLIKRRLDKGLYKRLDHFQEDMFGVFERARNLTRSDSQVFEDSVEMQTFYISCRDQLCKDGAVLQSPALRLTKEDLMASIELVKQCNMLEEHIDEDNETRSSYEDSAIPTGGQPIAEPQYAKGEYVYIQGKKGARPEPSILLVERVWNAADDVPMVYGNCFFRPHETFHVTTRKFLEQEVFKTDSHISMPLDQVVGKCCVMSVKDYFKLKPEGFVDKDIYVLESRYSTKSRSFKKIKVWPAPEHPVRLFPRTSPLEPRRVMSVFRQRVEKHKDELAELDVQENVTEKERPNVVIFNPLGGDDENTYYEQYNTVCSGVIKTGDYVYVVTDGGKQMIAQVDSIWETKDGKCYFRGPWLIQPSEVIGTINKVFFKQEILLTAVHDSSPLVGIVGKCAVLYYDEYLKCRPTEIPESDVFVCEALYDESNRTSRKLKTGLRKYEHTEVVTVDEVYWFPRPLGPPPLASVAEVQQTPQVIRATSQINFYCSETLKHEDMEILLESSLDESSMASPATPLSGGAGPAGSPANQTAPVPPVVTPATNKKKREPNTSGVDRKKLVTGYILYSSDVRKAISAGNPESTFGEISRIVGVEWRSLPASTKQSWEEKAAKVNEESKIAEAAKIAESLLPVVATPPPNSAAQVDKSLHPDFTYECLWDVCDYQFEDFGDCTEHCIGEGTGHIQQYYSGGGPFQCLWRGCSRLKRQATAGAPFPNQARLTRHTRDLHINKGNGRNVSQSERSKNFVPSRNKAKPSVVQHRPSPQTAAGQTVSLSQLSPVAMRSASPMAGAPLRGAVPEPLFVSVPPRPHRVQHSEAYIRYIEGLHSEQKYISPWEKSFSQPPAAASEAPANSAKLLTGWFSEELAGSLVAAGPPSQPDAPNDPKVVKALWNLRDLMLKDAFAIGKIWTVQNV